MSIKRVKFGLLLMLALTLVMPSISNAESNVQVITEKKISDTVKKAVKSHGAVTEPLILETDFVDPVDGAKISIYVVPETQNQLARNGDVSIFATTPLSSHTITQGTKMIYSRPDGQPWTVDTATVVRLSFWIQGSSSNAIGSTSMKFGHQNSSGTELGTKSDTGVWKPSPLYYRYYTYSERAGATQIRFFIQNLSAADVTISGEVNF